MKQIEDEMLPLPITMTEQDSNSFVQDGAVWSVVNDMNSKKWGTF
jgi:hypothetical protein